MKRLYIGLILVMLAFAGSSTLLYAANVTHRAVARIKETFGDQTASGWYNLQPARELFHGSLAYEAEIVYESFLLGPLAAALAATGLFIGCFRTSGPLRGLCGFIGIISLLTLVITWLCYSESIWVVSVVVD